MTDHIKCEDLKFSLYPHADLMNMYEQYFREGRWQDGQIVPFHSIELSPAANILNYGQGIFEGLKAYRTARGKIVMFRPQKNAERFVRSAQKLALPPFSESQFMEAVKATVLANEEFIPDSHHGRCSLYLRPVCIGIEPQLGVAAAKEYLFYIYASPVGPYFDKVGVVKFLVMDVHRAAPRGTGDAKAVCNYPVTMRPKIEAKKAGFDDVIYLDPVHDKYIEEAGAANVFVLLKNDVLVTPPLGSILPGITRESVITLAKDILGLKVEERDISVEEVIENGKEMFVTGTAATITSVSDIGWKGTVHNINRNDYQLALQLYDILIGIQLQEREDPYNWVFELK